MSYDIYLNDPVTGGIIELDEPHQMRGGTYAVGGTTEAWLNVTYNYSGVGHGNDCDVFVTKFEGGMGIIPSWIEVAE